MSIVPLEALPIETLRRRRSSKWSTYPSDVIPLFVAESDFPLADSIQQTLMQAVQDGDTGYTPPEPGIRQAFAEYALRRWNWNVDPSRVRSTGDVMMGVVELLRVTTNPGDRVITMPPVYPPFQMCIEEARAEDLPVPLIDNGFEWEIDLAGVGQALADGARVVLLCNPHNPTGTSFSADALAALAELAATHDAVVISDEIHGPLAHPGADFTPFLAASATAAEVGYVVTSASKAYNLAGLKCALMVSGADHTSAVVQAMSPEVEWRTGLLGALANIAAFAPESDEWLESLLLTLDNNRRLLRELLHEHLPRAIYRLPDAGYLAWIDVSAYGWGDDPATVIREATGVALHHGHLFGPQGVGHVRLNFGCSPDVLREALGKVGAFAAGG